MFILLKMNKHINCRLLLNVIPHSIHPYFHFSLSSVSELASFLLSCTLDYNQHSEVYYIGKQFYFSTWNNVILAILYWQGHTLTIHSS